MDDAHAFCSQFLRGREVVARKIVGAAGQAPIRMVLRGGVAVAPPETFPIATVTIRDYSTLLKLIFSPEIGFGDGYSAGSIELDGDLVDASKQRTGRGPLPPPADGALGRARGPRASRVDNSAGDWRAGLYAAAAPSREISHERNRRSRIRSR